MTMIEKRAEYDRVCADIQGVLYQAAGRTLNSDEGVKLEKMFAQQDELRSEIESGTVKEAAELRLDRAAPMGSAVETSVPARNMNSECGEYLREFSRGRLGDSIEFRAPTATTTSSSDDQIPLELYSRYIRMVDRLSAVRQAAEVDRFASSDIRFSRQTTQVTIQGDGSNNNSPTDEGSAFADFDIGTGDVVPTVKAFTAWSQLTNAIIEDSAFSIEDQVLQQHAEAISHAAEVNMIQGTNSFGGVFTDQVSNGGSKHTTSSTDIGIQDLIDAYMKLAGTGYFYKPGAFIISGSAAEKILGDTDTAGRLLLQAQAQATAADPVPFRVMGKPVYITSGAVTWGSGTVQAAYLAEDSYHVADVGSIRFLRDQYTYASSGIVSLTSHMRTSGVFVSEQGQVAVEIG